MTWICNVLYRFMDYDAVNDSQERIFSCGSVAASFSTSQQQLRYFQRQQTMCVISSETPFTTAQCRMQRCDSNGALNMTK